jgi:hypothetical protein
MVDLLVEFTSKNPAIGFQPSKRQPIFPAGLEWMDEKRNPPALGGFGRIASAPYPRQGVHMQQQATPGVERKITQPE